MRYNSIIKTFMICLLIAFVIFSITNCDKNMSNNLRNERMAKLKYTTPLERCYSSCVWEKCKDHCIETFEEKLEGK